MDEFNFDSVMQSLQFKKIENKVDEEKEELYKKLTEERKLERDDEDEEKESSWDTILLTEFKERLIKEFDARKSDTDGIKHPSKYKMKEVKLISLGHYVDSKGEVYCGENSLASLNKLIKYCRATLLGFLETKGSKSSVFNLSRCVCDIIKTVCSSEVVLEYVRDELLLDLKCGEYANIMQEMHKDRLEKLKSIKYSTTNEYDSLIDEIRILIAIILNGFYTDSIESDVPSMYMAEIINIVENVLNVVEMHYYDVDIRNNFRTRKQCTLKVHKVKRLLCDGISYANLDMYRQGKLDAFKKIYEDMDMARAMLRL